jgi:hypothetical protein
MAKRQNDEHDAAVKTLKDEATTAYDTDMAAAYPPDPAPPAAAAPAPTGTESTPPAATAEPTAAPTTESAASSEQDFDIMLKSNDNPTATQTVVARGIDPGLAAQTAMRQHPGWTADHAQTHPHDEAPTTHPADTTHGER